MINENTRVEEVATPDGVKRRIREADRVFDRKLCRTRLYLEFAPQERLYGLGQEEEGAWDLRHTAQYLHQANLKIAIPLLLSGNGYGILLSTQGTAVFNDTQYGSYLYTEADEYLDYYFLAGSPDEVVGQFRALTGRAVHASEVGVWLYPVPGAVRVRTGACGDGGGIPQEGHRAGRTGAGLDVLDRRSVGPENLRPQALSRPGCHDGRTS